MEAYISAFIIQLFCFRTDRLLTVLLVLFALLAFSGYFTITASKRGKILFWLGGILVLIGIGMTAAGYFWQLPHGLNGRYYAAPDWSEDPDVELDRYFETNGQRVDRFLDFNPNDFNSQYPFSGKPFSVKWEGYVYVPEDHYELSVTSNFGAWLYVDRQLIAGPHQIDFGEPEARIYLRKGWSADEYWAGNPEHTFLWSSGSRSEFYLGVDELTDYQLIFRCRPFMYDESPSQNLSIFINGVPLQTLRLRPEWKTYQVNVPASALQKLAPGFFRVRFAYSHTIRPADVQKNSTDGRQLAVAFDWAKLQKMSASMTNSPATQQQFETVSLARGFHRILLKARSDGENPFLRLLWKPEASSTHTIVPEDVLFPESFSTIQANQVYKTERSLLLFRILFKGILLVLLAGIVIMYLLPEYFPEILTYKTLWVGGIVLFALLIRMLLLFELHARQGDILPPGTDQLNYVFYARGFLRGYWPGLSHQPFYFNPLISWYFVVISALFGEELVVIRLVTTTLSGLSVMLVYLIARRLINRPVAYLAAILCACNGVLMFYDRSVLIAPVFTFLCLVILWLSLQLQARPSFPMAAALGIVVGLGVLARSNILLYLSFLFVWIVMGIPVTLRKKFQLYALICLFTALAIFPATLYNYFSNPKHPFVLTTSSGGINFWMGNNPSSTGEYGFSAALLEETRERMKRTGTSYIEEVLQYIKTQPVNYLKLEYKKFKMFWRGYEIGNLLPYYTVRQDSSRILRLPWLNFVLIGPLSLAGMWLARKQWKTCFLLYSFVCIHLLTTVFFLALARYRIPAVPVLSIFAAYFLYVVFDLFRKREYRAAIISLFAFLVLYVTLNYPYAAEIYAQHYQRPMPLLNLVRYWDLFHFHAP